MSFPDKYIRVPYSKRSRIGTSRPIATGKHANTVNINSSVATKTLVSKILTTIEQDKVGGTNESDNLRTDRRYHDQIWLEGFKIFFHFTNDASTRPCVLHMAVVNPHDNETPDSERFLRDWDSARSYSIGPTNNGIGADFRPINTDKFDVWMHKSWTVGGLVDTTVQNQPPTDFRNWTKDNIYVPVKRVVHYQGEGGNACLENFFLCYWLAEINDPGGSPQQVFFSLQLEAFAFFEDVK